MTTAADPQIVPINPRLARLAQRPFGVSSEARRGP